MVKGLEKFKEYFGAYPENYVLIGGTAYDVFMGIAGSVSFVAKPTAENYSKI